MDAALMTYGDCIRNLAAFYSDSQATPSVPTSDSPTTDQIHAILDRVEQWAGTITAYNQIVAESRVQAAAIDQGHKNRENTAALEKAHQALCQQQQELAKKPEVHYAATVISEAIWLFGKESGTRRPKPAWTDQDTFRVLSYFAGLIPSYGSEAQGALEILGALSSTGDGGPSQEDLRFEHLQTEITNVKKDLERLMITLDLEADTERIFTEAILLRSTLDRMRSTSLAAYLEPFIDVSQGKPARPVPAFTADWTRLGKTAALQKGNLGRVWRILDEFSDFDILLKPPDKELSIGLNAKPTRRMWCASLFLEVAQTVIDALVMYSLVCLLPESAFRSNWDPSSFHLDEAMASGAWDIPWGDADLSRSARDCWARLNLDLKQDAFWPERVDQASGDARMAYDHIRRRLGGVIFDHAVHAHRGDFWYVPGYTTYHLGTKEGVDQAFLWTCKGVQDTLRDPVLKDVEGCDFFASGFRGFTRSFKTKAGLFGWVVYRYTTPYSVKQGRTAAPTEYDDLCWAPAAPGAPFVPDMSMPMVRSVVAWLGYVLANYADVMNYTLGHEGYPSTLRLAELHRIGWDCLRGTSEQLLNTFPRRDDPVTG